MLVAALVILFGAIVLSMFVGWIIRIFIFCGFWFLSYWWLLGNVPWAKGIALTFGTGFTISWAAMIPSIICFLCLMFTRE
jgi:hypothetical protein